METVPRGTPLDPWYVTGFADGEGSFTYSRSGRQFVLYFSIKLTATDRPLLEALRDFFGAGKIYEVKARPPTRAALLFRVSRADELERVLEHFDAYPLRGAKQDAYRIWRQMVVLKRGFRDRLRDHDELDSLDRKLTATSRRRQDFEILELTGTREVG